MEPKEPIKNRQESSECLNMSCFPFINKFPEEQTEDDSADGNIIFIYRKLNLFRSYIFNTEILYHFYSSSE